MHHALYIEEILLRIFSHCSTLTPHEDPRRSWYANQNLVALASTCQTFKELALDLVWTELPNLTPLVRCLPNVSSVNSQGMYSFQRRLEDADWEALRKYTSRVCVLNRLRNTSGLAVDCINQLSNPPSGEPFFPKLQSLALYEISTDLYPFVLRHLTNLRLGELTLKITGSHGSVFRSFGHLCPNVARFNAVESGPHAEIVSDLICHWSNLRLVTCYGVVPSFAALSHLSALCTVLSLAFTANDVLVDQLPDTYPLPFSTLNQIYIHSGSLIALWRLFYRLHLPVLRNVKLSLFQVHPTPANVLSVFTAIGKACTHESLNKLTIWMPVREHDIVIDDPSPCRLTFGLLRPLTVFRNLRTISLDVLWGVDLNENELLTLASSWPRLTWLALGDKSDWTPSSGITPEGFVRLLELCRSLKVLFVILNTQGYTEIPHGHPWRGRTMPKNTFLHLLNSPIEEDSIEALGAFFQVAPYPRFSLTTHWNYRYFRGRRPQARESLDTYYERWSKAREIARDLSESRRKLLKSIEARVSEVDPAPDSDSESCMSDE